MPRARARAAAGRPAHAQGPRLPARQVRTHPRADLGTNEEPPRRPVALRPLVLAALAAAPRGAAPTRPPAAVTGGGPLAHRYLVRAELPGGGPLLKPGDEVLVA